MDTVLSETVRERGEGGGVSLEFEISESVVCFGSTLSNQKGDYQFAVDVLGVCKVLAGKQGGTDLN